MCRVFMFSGAKQSRTVVVGKAKLNRKLNRLICQRNTGCSTSWLTFSFEQVVVRKKLKHCDVEDNRTPLR